MKYIIMGLPGVGKTSVVKQVLEKVKLMHIHWGTLSEKVALEMGLVNHIDELRNTSPQEQIKVRDRVVREIVKITKDEKDVLIETHAVLKGPKGYFPGLTPEIIKKIKPDVFILIEAEPEVILKRRKGDETRIRKDDLTLKDVEESIGITRTMVATYAIIAQGTAYFVENKQGNLSYAIDRIVNLILK